MPMLNRELTAAEIDALLTTPPNLLSVSFLPDFNEPWPLFVHYDGRNSPGHADYTPRDFYRFEKQLSPSASVWIVPGSAQRR